MKVYTVFDRKMKEHGSLVLFKNEEAAVRGMTDAFGGQDTIVAKHPEDFDLICIGSYDQDQGVVYGGVHDFVVNFGELLRKDVSQLQMKLEA